MMLATWNLTVLSATNSVRAVSRLDSPRASSRSTRSPGRSGPAPRRAAPPLDVGVVTPVGSLGPAHVDRQPGRQDVLGDAVVQFQGNTVSFGVQ
jgi:hypothetical protein